MQSTVGAYAEKAGIPAVSLMAPRFVDVSKISVRGHGLSSIAMATIPFEVLSGAKPDIHPSCEAATQEIISALTKWETPEAAEVAKEEKWLEFEGVDYQDAAEKVNNSFLAKGWGDGLPLIPPTEERVDWMLTGTDLPRDKVLSTKLYTRCAPITVENVAVAAVMAGARPEYMPVILAATDLLDTENGLKQMHFIQESATGFAPVLMINGPITKELNINSSFGALGPGFKANATIGRAFSLLLRTAGPGPSSPAGCFTALSLPERYTFCFAENEAENPWQPLHVELGYSEDMSTVSLEAGRGIHAIMAATPRRPAEKVLGAIVRAVQGTTIESYGTDWDLVLILSPNDAGLIANAGFSKEGLKNFIYEKARITVAEAESASIHVHGGIWKETLGISGDSRLLPPDLYEDIKNTLVPITDRPDRLVIVVTGGIGPANSNLVACNEKMVTGDIDKFRPAKWQEFIKKAKAELSW